MLKDLEQRGARPNEPKGLPSNAFLVANSEKKSLPVFKVILVMLVIITGIYFLWQKKINPVGALLNSAANNTISDIQPANAVHSTNLPTEANQPITPAPSPASTNQQEINSNIAMAARPLFESELHIDSASKVEMENKYQQQEEVNNKPVSKQDKNISAGITALPKTATAHEEISTESKPTTLGKAAIENTSPKKNTNQGSVVKQTSPVQLSYNYYKHALGNLQQGRVSEAQSDLSKALEIDATNHEARQTLVSLLLENKRMDDAKTILKDGLKIAPEQNVFRMALARLQVDEGRDLEAFNTLEQGLAYAKQDADLHSFFATLLQRTDRHEEAVKHYMTSLSINPQSNPSTLVGLGISLQKTDRPEEAKQAYKRAQDLSPISPVLLQFIDQQLKQIDQRLKGH